LQKYNVEETVINILEKFHYCSCIKLVVQTGNIPLLSYPFFLSIWLSINIESANYMK